MTGQGLKSPAEVAAYVGVPLATVYAWQSRGTGPRYLRVGKHVRYRPAEVEAWLNSRPGGSLAA